MDGRYPGGSAAGSATRDTVRVASFNVHMGVDGWGRPYDLVEECAALDADVLVLQEAWTPDDGSPGTADVVASGLGYTVVAEAPLAHARLYAPIDTDTGRWAPMLGQIRKTLRLDEERFKVPAGSRDRPAQSGTWGVALLARVPCRDVEVVSLGKLRRDPAARAVIRCTTGLGGRKLIVHGTHMSHITHLSPAQYRRLARLLPALDQPALLRRRHEHVGTAGIVVLRRVATGRDRADLAGPPAAQPARPRPRHPRRAGGGRPRGRRHRIRPPPRGGDAGASPRRRRTVGTDRR